MLESLLFVVLLGGIPVIYSYVALYIYAPNQNDLWANLTGGLKNGWKFTMLLTVLSYIYMSYRFIQQDQFEPYLCACYTVFLGSASQWALFAIIDIKNEEKSIFIQINLWITAFATGGFLGFSIAITEPLLILCCGIIFLHHAFFDAWMWSTGFLPENNKKNDDASKDPTNENPKQNEQTNLLF
tara:strand:- start:2441 stop:2992 length:552 start_codon:yes stop_codon:yes gene_type:complete